MIKIGTCAWSFEDWPGVFYPLHLSRARWLDYYARWFSAVEIDSTFYHIPGANTARHWHDQTPDDFCFTCKMPRAITHEARLRDCDAKLDFFLESLEPLRPKLGCVLVKLPPGFHPRHDETALRQFLARLPSGIRFAVEFGHGDWHLPRIASLLEEHRICRVWNDITPHSAQQSGAFEFLPQTTDFLYVRLLGDSGGGFHSDGTLLWPRDSSLESWALKIKRHLQESKRVFVFAGNHFEGFSPLTCRRIAKHLGVSIELPGLENFEEPAGHHFPEQISLL